MFRCLTGMGWVGTDGCMMGFWLRCGLVLVLGASVAVAQPVSPRVEPSKLGATAVKPTVQAAPRTPVVQAKPGGPAHPAAKPKPKAKPHGKPVVAPAVVPVPVPVPAPEPEKPAEPTKGTNTGNPLPRFATLRTDEVNLRTGPGTRYPIDWVYKRRDLPVMIEREFEVWRLVRDPEGVKGWVHQATLAPRRTGVVIGGDQVLRQDPKADAASVAVLKPGVIVRLRTCEAASDWCQAQVQDYRGWIRRTDVWGIFPGEAIQ